MLQVFIYINIFLAGAAVALAIWYAFNHFSAKKHPEEPLKPLVEPPKLSKTARERLLGDAEHRFHMIVEHAADELRFDLKATSDAVSGRLKSLGDDVSETEMKRYQSGLEQLREQTETSIKNAASEVAKHQEALQAALAKRHQELEAALVQDIAVEKQRRIAELDTKLSGAVTAFLLDTLGHDVDLGAQSTYLIKTLEEHKSDILKELGDES